MARPRVGVLALQGDVAEHLNALAQCGAEAREVRLPADLDGLAGLIVPGGESTTIGKLMAEYRMDAAVRARHDDGMAVFGTCAGMILLAREIVGSDQPKLGLMDLTVRRNAFGRQQESFEAWLSAPEIGPEPLEAVFIRAPYVDRAGPEAQVLADIDGKPVLARQGRCLAAAFHPELTGDRRLHRYFVRMSQGG